MNGIYVDVIEGFTSITGYTREEVIGKSSGEINIWGNPEDRLKILEMLKKNGNIENLEIVFRIKDGSLITALLSANVITLNEKPHVILICRDISDRKKAENELRLAKEKAEESNRLKTSFLANLSHELRTPMNGILGFAELLDDDTLTREIRNEYISVINDSGQSLLEVITNLMDISKIDSQQIESRVRSFKLNELLNELFRWIKSERIYREKSHIKLELVTELTDEESIITSDPGKIRHIFSLLLHNAAKFTSEGTIRFGYSIHGEHIRLFVQDTGKGISRDKQQTIFERFRQEDETMSRKYGGVGLGLTIAKSLVNLIGGDLMLDSELGKGSTFWFEIPVR
jgi:PAS domain S-box-containing protein